MRSALQSRALYAVGDQIVFSFGNMVVAALVSRHCARADFGVYILTQRVLDILIQLSNGLLWTPLTFALPSLSAQRKAEYQGSIVLLQTAFCAVFTGVLWLASRAAAIGASSAVHATFQALVLTCAGILFREFTRRLYFAELRLKEAFWTEVATVAFQIAGVIWLYRSGKLTIPATLLMLCAGCILVSLWWLLREWRTWTVSGPATLRDLRGDFRQGRWLFGGNMVALASAQWNPWMLNALLGSAAVGTYSICESLVNIPRAALTSMQNVMGPVVARAHHQQGTPGVRSSVRRVNQLLFAASAGFGVLVFAASPLLAKLIYGTVPGGTHLVTLVLGLNLVAYVATLAQAYGLMALDRADLVLYANVAGLFAQAIACRYLVRSCQVPGAAAALLLGSLAVLASRQWFFSRQISAGSVAGTHAIQA